MKQVEVRLAYFKQGDDMAYHLKEEKSVEEAFRAHAKRLRTVAEHLETIANKIKDQKVGVDADTHVIMLNCEDELADQLLKEKFAERCPFEDEEEEDGY